MTFEVAGEIVHWRGPAPFLFVRTSDALSEQIKEIAPLATYGWGCIPATVRLGGTRYTTSLFPKEGAYMIPVKVAVQRAEKVGEGDWVELVMEIDVKLPD